MRTLLLYFQYQNGYYLAVCAVIESTTKLYLLFKVCLLVFDRLTAINQAVVPVCVKMAISHHF